MTTVRRLHQLLGQLVDKGHGRKPVCVDKASFRHPLESDGAVVLNLAGVRGPVFIGMCDDDGGTKWNQDGSPSGQQTVVLFGDADDERDTEGRLPADVVAQQLLEHCKAFIEEQAIGSAESVYQCDGVILNAAEFIEGICRIAGYHKEEDE